MHLYNQLACFIQHMHLLTLSCWKLADVYAVGLTTVIISDTESYVLEQKVSWCKTFWIFLNILQYFARYREVTLPFYIISSFCVAVPPESFTAASLLLRLTEKCIDIPSPIPPDKILTLPVNYPICEWYWQTSAQTFLPFLAMSIRSPSSVAEPLGNNNPGGSWCGPVASNVTLLYRGI